MRRWRVPYARSQAPRFQAQAVNTVTQEFQDLSVTSNGGCEFNQRDNHVLAILGGLSRDRGYKNLGYLLLKAQRMAVTKTEFIVLQKAA
jgi:hypothetical protein